MTAVKPRGLTGKKRKTKIDRKKENNLVLLLQNDLSNSRLFSLVYEPRIPTIVHLAGRYAWLGEDVESEINVVFLRSIEKFTKSKRDFNTFFYTNVLNHIRNMMKARKRQKRTLCDGSDPALTAVHLDSDGDDDRSYHEIIPCHSNVVSNVSVSEMFVCVMRDSWVLYDIMLEIASNGSPCCRRRNYSNNISLRDGETVESSIQHDVGIPDDLYRIEESSISDDLISYKISVSGQRTMKYLSTYLKNKGFVG